MGPITVILDRASLGDPQAAEQLLPLVYDELRKLAAAKLVQENPGQTLQATALVHEVYLRLVGGGGDREQGAGDREGRTEVRRQTPESVSGLRSPVSFQSRSHFFAAAAEAMRRILIDQARKKRSLRHGGGRQRCELSDGDYITLPISDDLLDLDEA
ncbi:MAG TPA: ECF-type sigma factor, partial [Pirellulaceae bacterium]|nr:ECF-type sigma factor [Pirellulaceae bacterium]